MSPPKQTWQIIDHVCRHCPGGRLLKLVTGGGPTPGGNPTFRCSCCGKAHSASNPKEICWCGQNFRGGPEGKFQCVPYSILREKPFLEEGFRAMGCDPGRRDSEVGVISTEDWNRLHRASEGHK